MLGGGLSREEAVLDCDRGPDFSQQNNNKALCYQKAIIIEVLPIESKTIPFQIGPAASLESYGGRSQLLWPPLGSENFFT